MNREGSSEEILTPEQIAEAAKTRPELLAELSRVVQGSRSALDVLNDPEERHRSSLRRHTREVEELLSDLTQSMNRAEEAASGPDGTEWGETAVAEYNKQDTIVNTLRTLLFTLRTERGGIDNGSAVAGEYDALISRILTEVPKAGEEA